MYSSTITPHQSLPLQQTPSSKSDTTKMTMLVIGILGISIALGVGLGLGYGVNSALGQITSCSISALTILTILCIKCRTKDHQKISSTNLSVPFSSSSKSPLSREVHTRTYTIDSDLATPNLPNGEKVNVTIVSSNEETSIHRNTIRISSQRTIQDLLASWKELTGFPSSVRSVHLLFKQQISTFPLTKTLEELRQQNLLEQMCIAEYRDGNEDSPPSSNGSDSSRLSSHVIRNNSYELSFINPFRKKIVAIAVQPIQDHSIAVIEKDDVIEIRVSLSHTVADVLNRWKNLTGHNGNIVARAADKNGDYSIIRDTITMEEVHQNITVLGWVLREV